MGLAGSGRQTLAARLRRGMARSIKRKPSPSRTLQKIDLRHPRTIQLPCFAHLALLIPTIEASSLLHLEERSVTLGDVVYSKLRQYQQLMTKGESSAVAALEKRWAYI